MSGDKVLFFDPQKCIGCRLCEIWCSIEHFGAINPKKSNIRIFRDHEKQIDVAHYCHQCEDTPCIDACNFDALSQDKDSGAILVNEENCTGCGLCVKECPHEEAVLRPDVRKIMICDLCGGSPSCVEHCPEEAIVLIGREKARKMTGKLKFEHEYKKVPAEEGS